jgi:multidrug efflux pump
VGNIYRQFSAVMGVSIAFSAFMALSLTPALCATLLKPVEAGHHHAKTGFFGWFNRGFSRTAKGYEGVVHACCARGARTWSSTPRHRGRRWRSCTPLAHVLPAGNEDQGTMLVNVQLPPGATQARTLDVMEQVEGFMLKQPEVQSMVSVLGFSFSGQGQNAALAFVTLKDWERAQGAGQFGAGAWQVAPSAALMGMRDAFIFPLSPPPIPELGSSSGFSFRLQDRAGLGHDALLAARNQLLGMASKSKILTSVRPDGLEDAPQLQLDIDRDKANALGVSFDAINSAISTALGSATSTTSPTPGGCSAWSCRPTRRRACSRTTCCASACPTTRGRRCRCRPSPAPAGSPARCRRALQRLPVDAHQRQCGARATAAARPWPRWNGWRPAAAGLRLRMDRPVARGKNGRLAGLHPVRLCHAGGVPGAGRLVRELVDPAGGDPGGAAGRAGRAAGHADARLSNDIYFQVGLITIIGLSAKNAVLIIEFAKDLQAQGKGVIEAALAAAHLRFRPIVMTSMAFILGVLPLAISTWCRLGQPARHRHRRDRRHAERHRAGGVVRADLLRGGARPVQGQPATAAGARRAGRAHGGAFR